MLKIRLQRIGKRGQAYFRVVVLEHTKKPKGEFLELLGSYDPHQKQFKAKKDRLDYWVSKGAQVSPTVNNLLINYKVWDKEKMQSWKPKKKEKGAPASEAAPAPTPKPKEDNQETRLEEPAAEPAAS